MVSCEIMVIYIDGEWKYFFKRPYKMNILRSPNLEKMNIEFSPFLDPQK